MADLAGNGLTAQSPTRRVHAASCLECGAPFGRSSHPGAFCAPRCREAWNNRRKARGAELYDLFMAMRFERGRARLLSLYTALCRAASLFRDQDVAERAGRRSWGDPAEVLARRPYLRAKMMVKARPPQVGG